MKKVNYRISFTTPAFLGNANQHGQWRTPPFKALLRQWWRVVWATRHNFRGNIEQMRRDEGRLFGNAWLKNDFRKSEVRIRLSKWDEGKWNKGMLRDNKSDLVYLGYGPLNQSKRAIHAGQWANLSIAMPDGAEADIRSACVLIHAYGAVGGRSRNGWGSVCLEAPDGPPEFPPTSDFQRWMRNWRQALDLDWPHTIGKDESGPLVWQTAATYKDWSKVLCELSKVKKHLRKERKFEVRKWQNKRLPNTLRFKVRRDPSSKSALRGVVFHVPCKPPQEFGPDLDTIKNVWCHAHKDLDALVANGRTRQFPAKGVRVCLERVKA
ncbi:MAG: hypothetical protein OXD30_13520 [Bryobacterales bacterium]|nr:hypothetical protein [Bryobacterales bacterium]